MSQFYYINGEARLVHEPDDFDMDTEPELSLFELYEAQVAADTRDCLEDIQNEFAKMWRLQRRQAGHTR